MKNNINYFVVCILVLLGGCSKWIDVKPSDRLSEEVLFSSREGYLKALNGIYIELSNPVLYGQFMTASALDAMGQYYMLTSINNPYYYYGTYDYTRTETKSGFDAAWKKAYNIIFNINVLLEQVGDVPSDKLPEPYFSMVKGEALGLRAYLHFDMLRLFGPAWSDTQKNLPAIPYYINSKKELSPLFSSEEVLRLALQDLNDAAVLLKQSDPVLTAGVSNYDNPNGDNSMNYRQYRLNYYAVQALSARVYLWQGDKSNAGVQAKETIAAVQQQSKPIFPFVTQSAALAIDTPDRVFSTEVLFSMYTVNRVAVYNGLFSPALLLAYRLAPNAGNVVMTRVDAMYDDKNDYRYQIWQPYSLTGTALLTNQKFKDDVNSPGRYMIPMLRMGELYLIAAECSDNLTEAFQYLNMLRTARRAFAITASTEDGLRQALTDEYRREFICEGQQFFYYKRLGFTQVPNHATLTGNKMVGPAIYSVPLPESETAQRQ